MNPKQQFDFIGAVLSPLIAFSRSGNTATVINSSGNVASVSADVPRLDCSPTTLACLGLLVEETRTNSVRNNTMQGAVAGAADTVATGNIGILTGTGTIGFYGTLASANALVVGNNFRQAATPISAGGAGSVTVNNIV